MFDDNKNGFDFQEQPEDEQFKTQNDYSVPPTEDKPEEPEVNSWVNSDYSEPDAPVEAPVEETAAFEPDAQQNEPQIQTEPQNGWQQPRQFTQTPPPPQSPYAGYNNYHQYTYPGGNPQQQQPQPQKQQYNPYYGNQPTNSYNANNGGFMQTPPAVPKKNNAGLKVFSIILCVLVFGIAISLITLSISGTLRDTNGNGGKGTAQNGNADGDGAENFNPDAPTLDIQDDLDEAGGLSTVDIAKKVRPSVVGVVSYTKTSMNQSGGEGSGIIMTADGYIITNAHVVAEKTNMLKVVMSDGNEYEAKLIGMDTKTDIAVIKIEATGLPAAEFGNSDALQVGENVVAIGNPGGLQFAGSVTKGIVSAVGRTTSSAGYTNMKYIQIDAPINPGNSGGALVNIHGQVVGINSSKIVASGYEGIGFAIPISQATPIINDLTKNGYVQNRIKLGITAEAISEVAAEFYQVPTGLLIREISNDSDLNNHGVTAGDIITKADGKKLKTMDDLFTELQNKKPGDTITLTIYRGSGGGLERTFEVTAKLIEDRG